eukprot:54167_1
MVTANFPAFWWARFWRIFVASFHFYACWVKRRIALTSVLLEVSSTILERKPQPTYIAFGMGFVSAAWTAVWSLSTVVMFRTVNSNGWCVSSFWYHTSGSEMVNDAPVFASSLWLTTPEEVADVRVANEWDGDLGLEIWAENGALSFSRGTLYHKNCMKYE